MDDLTNLCNLIKERLRNKWDICVGITGEEGVGKTSLGIQMGIKIDDDFGLERNIIYIPDYKQIIDKITKTLPMYAVVLVDEAIKTMYKRKWHGKLQIFLNQIYAICRKECKCSLLLMPDFNDFDSFFRQHRIYLWIHIISRGWAVVFIRDWSPFTTDKWHIEKNQKIVLSNRKRKKISDENISHKLKVLRKSPNYLMDFRFNPLPKKIEEAYTKLNKEYRLTMPMPEEGGLILKYREAIKSMATQLNKEKNWTQQEIADGFGLHVNTIAKQIHTQTIIHK